MSISARNHPFDPAPVRVSGEDSACRTCGGARELHRLTLDPNDPRLTHGVDEIPGPQNDAYLVSREGSEFVRPYRDKYRHLTCGTVTTMGRLLSETYARDPKFYGATYCCGCEKHLPVSEFVWDADGQVVGS